MKAAALFLLAAFLATGQAAPFSPMPYTVTGQATPFNGTIPSSTIPSTTMSKRDKVEFGESHFEYVWEVENDLSHTKLGVRNSQAFEIGQKCRIVEFTDQWVDEIVAFTYGDGTQKTVNSRGPMAKIHCNKSLKNIVWDIKRIGDPWDCGEYTITKTRTMSTEITNELKVMVETSVAAAGFSLSAGFSYSNTVKESNGQSLEVSCAADNKETTCRLGGPALIELTVWEGYAVFPWDGEKPKYLELPGSIFGPKAGVYGYPQGLRDVLGQEANADLPWTGKGEWLENNGLTDVSEVTMYSYNNNYPGSMDTWPAKGNGNCRDLVDNRAWPATYANGDL